MAEWPYSTQRWQRLQATKLAHQPTCEDCGPRLATPATDILPTTAASELLPALTEVVALCDSCALARRRLTMSQNSRFLSATTHA